MYTKKIKEEVRPCVNCKTNHMIFDRMKWLCKKCTIEKQKERRGDLRGLFEEIWRERPHICVKCGKQLGDRPQAIFFSHIKSRSAFPSLKMDKNNIELLCSDCHYLWDFGDRSKLNNSKDNSEE